MPRWRLSLVRSHPHPEPLELTPATWRDPKRYAWLLGLIVPLAPFHCLGRCEGRAAGEAFGSLALCSSWVFPLLDIAIGLDASNPPDSVLKWLEQDRYYRWCTYLFIPVSTGPDLCLLAMVKWRPIDPRQHRAGGDDGGGRGDHYQHRS